MALIFKKVSSEKFAQLESVPKNRGIRGSLPVLAGNGRDGIRKNHQCCNGG